MGFTWDLLDETNKSHLKMDGLEYDELSFWGKRPIFRGYVMLVSGSVPVFFPLQPVGTDISNPKVGSSTILAGSLLVI